MAKVIRCAQCKCEMRVTDSLYGANVKCPKCGYVFQAPAAEGGSAPRDIPEVQPAYQSRDIGEDAGMRMLLPVGRSGWAIAAGYLGLLSVLCVPAPFALLTAILAMREMRRDPKKHGMGRAVFGLIMGAIGTLGLVIVILSIGARLAKGR